jgi:hypothetical protein
MKVITMKLRLTKGKTEKRAICALFLTPLLVPLTLLISSRLQSEPVFQIPINTRVLVSMRNPFSSLAGPVYFERLASSNPPPIFWQQMKQVSSSNQGFKIESGTPLRLMNANYIASRDHHQSSFKVLGVPQISMSSPSFHSSGRIGDAHVKVYVWADGHGGSIMELWVMDKF